MAEGAEVLKNNLEEEQPFKMRSEAIARTEEKGGVRRQGSGVAAGG